MMRDAILLIAAAFAVGACDPTGSKTAELEERVAALETDLEDAQAAAKHVASTREKTEELDKRLAQTESELAAIDKRSAADEKTLETLRTELDSLKMEVGKVAEQQTGAATDEEPELTAVATVGVATCDEYLSKYSTCINSKMPESARATTLKALRQTADAWKQAAATESGQKALEQACTTALETAKKAFSGMGCTF